MTAGRPTEYDQARVLAAQAYLSGCKDTHERELDKEDNPGRETFVVNLPSVAGLAVYLGVARSTIYKWKDLHPEFSDILELILAEQEKRLLENGLAGTYAASITKLALGKHGYKDEKGVEHDVGETLADLMRDADEEDSDGEEEEAA
jgi:hypothetical protein